MFDGKPFLQIDVNEFNFHVHPTEPAGFAGLKEDFDKFLADHEKEHKKKTGKNKFPFCCDLHKFIFEDVKKGFEEAIAEKKFDDRFWFSKEKYANLPLKITSQIFLTQYHIDNTYTKPDAVQDIAEYIEYIISTFGQPPIFANYYLSFLKHIVANSDGNEEEKKVYKGVLDFMENEYYTNKEPVAPTDLNELYATYQKWIEHFPFDTVYFKELKEKYQKQLPLYMNGTPTGNRYTGLMKGKVHDKIGLIRILVNTTKDLLKQVDAAELVRQSVIPDTKQHTLQLLNENLRIKNELLFGEFSNGETEYMEILQKWLSYQKEYFTDIAQITSLKIEPLETKRDILTAAFGKYGLYDLPKVKILNDNQKSQLSELLCNNDVPFQIAMFSYLAYFDYLIKNYTQSKTKLNKLLAEILGCDERTVKGNIAVLQAYSKENKKRYTAHQQKKNVQIAYQTLK